MPKRNSYKTTRVRPAFNDATFDTCARTTNASVEENYSKTSAFGVKHTLELMHVALADSFQPAAVQDIGLNEI